MSPGSLTMVCVLLVSGQTAPPPALPSPPPGPAVPTAARVEYLNTRTFKVPVDIDADRRREIRELVLYVSPDAGKTWGQYAKIARDKDAFNFYGREDGQFWFRVAAINLKGEQEPDNLYRGEPDLKVVIDTVKPQMQIKSARREKDELVVAWEIREDHPDVKSLKIEYRVLDGSPPVWLPMRFEVHPTGEARAPLTSQAPVAVRISMRDLADNASFAEAEVQGLVPASFSGNGPGGPAVPPPPSGQGTLPAPAGQATGATREAKVTPTQQLPPPSPLKTQDPPPYTPAPHGSLPLPGGTSRVDHDHATAGQGAGTTDPAPEVVASTDRQGAAITHTTPSAPPAPAAPGVPPRGLPQLQLVNDKELTVEYELSKVGPSGIGTAKLYLTNDEGRSWIEFAEDPEAGKATAGGKYQRTLELPGEGVFGLYLVVRNRAGLGKAPPKPGDLPEMMVEVDLTPPSAELRKPVPDPARRDSVLLYWAAKDRNLAANPISLEFAKEPKGPWQPIASGLPNSGKHSWQVPEGLVSVYFRLRVADRAGNEGVAVTAEPQLVDLTVPEARLSVVRTRASARRP